LSGPAHVPTGSPSPRGLARSGARSGQSQPSRTPQVARRPAEPGPTQLARVGERRPRRRRAAPGRRGNSAIRRAAPRAAPRARRCRARAARAWRR
jgi:hypothetical protein